MIKQMRNSSQRFNKQTEFVLTIEGLSYIEGEGVCRRSGWENRNSFALHFNSRIGNSRFSLVNCEIDVNNWMHTIEVKEQKESQLCLLNWGKRKQKLNFPVGIFLSSLKRILLFRVDLSSGKIHAFVLRKFCGSQVVVFLLYTNNSWRGFRGRNVWSSVHRCHRSIYSCIMDEPLGYRNTWAFEKCAIS